MNLRDKLNANKRASDQGTKPSSSTSKEPTVPSPTQPESRRQRLTREWLTSAGMQQLDITAIDAERLQREMPATAELADPLRQKVEKTTSKGDPVTHRTIENATIGILYTRPVENPAFTPDGYPPWIERLRRDLERDNSTYLQPLQSANRLTQQRPGRYDESRLKTKNYARKTVTLLPMGKDLLQNARGAFSVDSTMNSSYNTNNTLMEVRVMNVPCTSLSEMTEVTDEIFTPAAAETIPIPPMLVYSIVINHLALRTTLKCFEPRHVIFTEGFVMDEVTAYVETMANIARTMKNKESASGAIFMAPPGMQHTRRT